MTTYNSRKLRRRRTLAQAWESYRPLVIALEAAVLMTLVWWALMLLGVV